MNVLSDLGKKHSAQSKALLTQLSSRHPTRCAAHIWSVVNGNTLWSVRLLTRSAAGNAGFGVHTYRFINADGKSTLFKWAWLPKLGHRSLVYDEATTLAGKNNDFQRVDLYNNIAAGIYPEWDFAVQLFPDDGTYMWQGYDLLIPTVIVPFEINPPIRMGKLTL